MEIKTGVEYKNQGNNLFKDKKYIEAIKSYTKAIVQYNTIKKNI